MGRMGQRGTPREARGRSLEGAALRDELAIHRFDPVHDPLDREVLLHGLPPRAAHLRPPAVVREEDTDLAAKIFRIYGVRQEPLLPVRDYLPDAGDVADDDRLPRRHRLERHDPERLEAGDGRQGEYVARREVRRELLWRDLACERHAIRD